MKKLRRKTININKNDEFKDITAIVNLSNYLVLLEWFLKDHYAQVLYYNLFEFLI